MSLDNIIDDLDLLELYSNYVHTPKEVLSDIIFMLEYCYTNSGNERVDKCVDIVTTMIKFLKRRLEYE